MSIVWIPRPLQRLSPKPFVMLSFLMERARWGNLNYVVGGATALQMHGIIDRLTEDVDLYISSGETLKFGRIIFPYLNQFRDERVIFPGLPDRWTDPNSLSRATKMTVFRHFDLNIAKNAKANISESPGLVQGDGTFVILDGLRVASVPVLTAFKLCAICRGSRNGQAGRLAKDVTDLIECLQYLTSKGQSIPFYIQAILDGPDEEFTWMSLRTAVFSDVGYSGHYILATLVKVGFHAADVYGFPS